MKPVLSMMPNVQSAEAGGRPRFYRRAVPSPRLFPAAASAAVASREGRQRHADKPVVKIKTRR